MELNWHAEYIQSQRNVLKGKSEILDSLFPVCGDYFSDYNPVFLEKMNSEILGKQKRWLSRDGVLSALWFFLNHSPKDFRGKIYVHRSLDSLIPDEWRPKVESYSIVSEQNSGKPSSLLVTGILSSLNMDEEDFHRELDKLSKLLGRRKLPVYAYLPCRGGSPGLDDTLPGKALTEMEKRFQGQIQFVDFRFFKYRPSFKDFYFHELNPGWLYCDSYLLHAALSKGAKLLEDPSSVKAIPLSPFHGLQTSPLGNKKAILPGVEEFSKAILLNNFSTSPQGQGPFPEGFVRLMKKHVRSVK